MLVRVAAAKALVSVITDGASLNRCLPELMTKVEERDKPLLQALCYGSLRWYPRLNTLLAELLEKPLKAKDSDIHVLLICALYQLLETRIPDHAAVNETVAALKKLKKPWAKGLVNAVLRRFIREKDALIAKQANKTEYVSAHPHWLYKRIRQAWPVQADDIIAANNAAGPMTLRVNQRHLSASAYLEILHSKSIEAQATALSAVGVQLTNPAMVESLPGFAEGHFSVQDEAAQLAARLLDVAPEQRVLDACCAPGGKTCHILEQEPALAELVAVDIDDTRLDRVRENLTRLNLQASLVTADAFSTEAWWDGVLFDRILLDAPCSATGVIRRHPDIKVLRHDDDIAQLAEIQLRLLEALWPLLKQGGKLLYATCSILPAENDDTITQFLTKQDDAEICTIAANEGLQTSVGRQFFPAINGNDGFYYALLSKL